MSKIVIRSVWLGLVTGGYFWVNPLYGQAFQLTELPRGKSVTLPHPALTQVPITERVLLTATDRAQTVKISLQVARPQAQPLKLAIYDNQGDRVQYLNLNHENPVLYAFSRLSTIQVVADSATIKDPGTTHLMIESNRPLEITR